MHPNEYTFKQWIWKVVPTQIIIKMLDFLYSSQI